MDSYVCLDGYIHGYIHVYMQNNIYHVICSEAAVRSIDIDGFHCLTAALAGARLVRSEHNDPASHWWIYSRSFAE